MSIEALASGLNLSCLNLADGNTAWLKKLLQTSSLLKKRATYNSNSFQNV